MSKIAYLDRDRKPMHQDEFERRCAEPGYPEVARTEVVTPEGRKAVLVTSWHGFDPDSPAVPCRIFETVICWNGTEGLEVVDRAATERSARIDHFVWGAMLTQGLRYP